MKKRIILITLILITFFIIFNYKVFLGNYYFYQAKGDYLNKNFSGALDGYNNSSKYLSGTKIDFNKGNTYYKIGERAQYTNDKIGNYTKSLELYSKILEENLKNKKKADPDVRYNYEFVKKKLEELQEKQKQDQEKKEEQKDEQKDEQEQKDKQEDKNQDEKDEKKDGKKEDSDKSKNSEEKDEKNGDKNNEEANKESKKDEKQGEENKSGNKAIEEESYKMTDQSKLSLEELKQIEDYVENLKEEEKYNREYLNNLKPMSNDPFFDSVFDRGDKDW